MGSAGSRELTVTDRKKLDDDTVTLLRELWIAKQRADASFEGAVHMVTGGDPAVKIDLLEGTIRRGDGSAADAGEAT